MGVMFFLFVVLGAVSSVLFFLSSVTGTIRDLINGQLDPSPTDMSAVTLHEAVVVEDVSLEDCAPPERDMRDVGTDDAGDLDAYYRGVVRGPSVQPVSSPF